MNPRYRRAWVFVVAALICVPLLAMALRPEGAGFAGEAVAQAPLPSFPRTLAGLVAFPKQIDAYLADRFGLRRLAVQAQAFIAQIVLRSGNDKVLLGRDGWMFLLLDNTVPQSAGLYVRPQMVVDTASLLSRINSVLAARHISFLVAIPPNPASIMGNELPP